MFLLIRQVTIYRLILSQQYTLDCSLLPIQMWSVIVLKVRFMTCRYNSQFIIIILLLSSQKLGFISRARGFFSPSQLLIIYKSQIRPSLEYCSHVWGGVPKSSLHLLDKVQSKVIRLINNPSLTKSLQSLSHRRLVADLFIFYRCFHGLCSLKIKNIIPDPLKHVRPTRSSTQSHPF